MRHSTDKCNDPYGRHSIWDGACFRIARLPISFCADLSGLPGRRNTSPRNSDSILCPSSCAKRFVDRSGRSFFAHLCSKRPPFGSSPFSIIFICGTIAFDEGSISMSLCAANACPHHLADGDFASVLRRTVAIMLIHHAHLRGAIA